MVAYHIEIVAKGKHFPTINELFSMLSTFGLVVFGWIFFRAESLEHAIDYISGIFSFDLFSWPYFMGIKEAVITILFIVLLIVMEWMGREQEYAIKTIALRWRKPFRWCFYYVIVMLIFLFGSKSQEFIYFQF